MVWHRERQFGRILAKSQPKDAHNMGKWTFSTDSNKCSPQRRKASPIFLNLRKVNRKFSQYVKEEGVKVCGIHTLKGVSREEGIKSGKM